MVTSADALGELTDRITAHLADDTARAMIVAIDGASAAGKTALAEHLAASVGRPAAVTVVHTDDIAWHHSFFGWHDLLRTGLLERVRSGCKPVTYRPPGWERHHRAGAVAVPANTRVLIVEGVGAAHRTIANLLDVVVWVQTPADVRDYRQRERLRAGIDSPEFMEDWNTHEHEFHRQDMPWTRADYMISGNDFRLRHAR